MKQLSKISIALISLGLLAGCNPGKSEPVAPADSTPPVLIDTEMTEPDSVEAMDDEMESMAEEESSLDEALNELEAEAL